MADDGENSYQSLKSDYIEMEDYIVFTDEDKAFIIDELDSLNIMEWYGRNKANDEWKIGIEYEDGTVITMSGSYFEGAEPDNYVGFINLMNTIVNM